MSEQGKKGHELMQQAEKKKKQPSLFGSTSKLEDAMELYQKAGAQFKIAKQWDDAGEAYLKAAECAEKLGSEVEAVGAYVDAAKAYKNGNTKEAIKAFRIAAEMRMRANGFSQAGKLHLEIAGIEEKNLNTKDAIKAFSEAADCFHAEGSVPSESQALLKVAELSATEEDYTRAIAIYEAVAATSLESSLMKFSAKDYFFKAALCQMVVCAKDGDMKLLEDKLEKYKDQHPAFDGDKGCKLIESCLKAFDDSDADALTDLCFAYDKLYKPDHWTCALLLIVKKIIKNDEVVLPGDRARRADQGGAVPPDDDGRPDLR